MVSNTLINRKLILWLTVAVLMMIAFESAQQYFYIDRYELVDTARLSFWGLFKGQFYRWVFWSLYSLLLWRFIQNNPIEDVNKNIIFKYTAAILILIILNIFTISIFHLFWQGVTLSVASLIDNVIFFTFQKFPIYLISYAVFIAITHYAMNSAKLEVHIQELIKLKESNLSLYEELKNKSYEDNSALIQVKTGNRTKLVPVDSILWIEADDYCVKIHDENGHSHTIRSSMKILEESLSSSTFIRVHRKAIINMNVVEELQMSDPPSAILKNGQQIPIAQSRIKNIRQQFEQGSLLAGV